MKRLPKFPFYIILAAIYPALALLSANIGQVRLDAAFRPLLVSIFSGILVFGALRLVMKDPNKAGVLTAVAMLMFFSYGHIYELLEGISLFGLNIGRHRVLFPIWTILALAGAWIVVGRTNLDMWAPRLTIPFSIAVAIPVVGITFFEAQSFAAQRQQESAVTELEIVGKVDATAGSLPDIYYIILDGYARQDVMLATYGFDNSDFLSELDDRGFVIASCSQSNYNHTDLSLASSLNFEYLDEFHILDSSATANRTLLPPLIKTSRVREILEGLGYQIVAFETGFPFTEVTDADTYLAPTSFARSLISGLSGFETLFMRSTAAAFLIDGITSFSDRSIPSLDGSDDWHRNHVLFAFESLERVASLRGPKFVFAHIVSPHEPFVLGPNGEFVQSPPREDGTYSEVHFQAYADQSRYLAKRTIEVIDVLIATTGSPPVIVVQSDHGPDLGSKEDNLKILNAIRYLEASGEVYPSITPVNTFRLILNSISGTDFPLEDDRSYYSTKDDPINFEELQLECTK